MNIFNKIRRNWLWITLCLLLLTISCSRFFSSHPLSWWNICWIILPIALGIFASNNDWIILRPVRWFLWICHKEYLEKKLTETQNPMAYPALIWLETNGQRVFVLAGIKGIQDGLFGQGEKTKGALTAILENMTRQGSNRMNKEKEKDSDHGCHDGGCGCSS